MKRENLSFLIKRIDIILIKYFIKKKKNLLQPTSIYTSLL